MTFLGIILTEKSKKHTQKIQKNFLDRVLDIFWPQSPKNMDFEVKNAQNTVKEIFFGFFKFVFGSFSQNYSYKIIT